MKKDVLEISQNSQEKTCTRVIFLNKKETGAGLQLYWKRDSQVLSCEFCEIFKNTFSTEHLWTTASISLDLYRHLHCNSKY